jgi:hypothetical protein
MVEENVIGSFKKWAFTFKKASFYYCWCYWSTGKYP